MADERTAAKILFAHFFRRFFDNDTIAAGGETETTVIRSLCVVAVTPLMFAFWLAPHYPGRPVWAIAGDQYFFVVYAFTAMGGLAALEWEMLFPDRSDFLVLLPLPLRVWQLFLAKARALSAFAGLFLAAAMVFGLLLLPAIHQTEYWRNAGAHLAAVASAGAFAFLAVLAVQGLAIYLLPARLWRIFSLLYQAAAISYFLLVLLLFPLFHGYLQFLPGLHVSILQCLPPLWFLALYENLSRSALANSWPGWMVPAAIWAPLAMLGLTVISYPLAWKRRQRMALEGAASTGTSRGLRLEALLRSPEERAVFRFVSQTIVRLPRYGGYMACYCGVGIAIALSCVMNFTLTGGVMRVALSQEGLHAVLPLLLFWLVAGLRGAFAFPVEIKARWAFVQNLMRPAAAVGAAKKWVWMLCGMLTFLVSAMMAVLGWTPMQVVVQALSGALMSMLLADFLFLFRSGIPFTQVRLPGRASLALTLTLYVGMFPAFVLLMIDVENAMEAGPMRMIVFTALAVGLHAYLSDRGRRAAERNLATLFAEEDVPEFQTLGLTR